MALTRVDNFIINALGQAQAGAKVYYLINQPGANAQTVTLTLLAAVFTDSTGATPAANPQIADGFGHTAIYVASGLYTYAYVLQNGSIQLVLPDQTVNIATASSGAIINATTGYQFNGAAPAGDTLIGNGTVFVAGTLSGIAGTIALSQTPLTTTGDLLMASGGALVRLPLGSAGQTLTVVGGVPTWTTGVITWNNIAGATGPTVINNSNWGTEFDQTGNDAWLWVNTTPATSIAPTNSPSFAWIANYWNGGASAQDAWTLGVYTSAGTNGPSQLSLTHAGTSGQATFAIGAPIIIHGATPVAGVTQLGLGTTTGFGTGSASTAVTTTTLGGGSGPTTPQTVVNYLQINLGGTAFWIPLVQ
jgi:hypothetical protein